MDVYAPVSEWMNCALPSTATTTGVIVFIIFKFRSFPAHQKIPATVVYYRSD